MSKNNYGNISTRQKVRDYLEDPFVNRSDLKFKNIDSEAVRTYHLVNGVKLEITRPIKFAISESGTHYIMAYSGKKFIIEKRNYTYISFTTYLGKPDFEF